MSYFEMNFLICELLLSAGGAAVVRFDVRYLSMKREFVTGEVHYPQGTA
jgi:hypothetical protein